MTNLNEIHRYDDPTDQWAAEREAELRAKAYHPFMRATVALRRLIAAHEKRLATAEPER